MAAYFTDVEYFSEASHTWVPLRRGGRGGGRLHPGGTRPVRRRATPRRDRHPTTGVVYPAAGDPIVGTTIAAGATATWASTVSVPLTRPSRRCSAAQQTGRLRSVTHLEVIPRVPATSQNFFDRAVLTNPFQPAKDNEAGGDDDTHQHVACAQPKNPAQSGTATAAKVAVVDPAGTTVVIDATTNAALASIAPGASTVATVAYRVPVLGARGPTETDADYLARLTKTDGTALTATATVTAAASNGAPLAAGPATASATEHLPVVELAKSGPANAVPGTTATYTLALHNRGAAPAAALAVTDTIGAGTASRSPEPPPPSPPAPKPPAPPPMPSPPASRRGRWSTPPRWPGLTPTPTPTGRCRPPSAPGPSPRPPQAPTTTTTVVLPVVAAPPLGQGTATSMADAWSWFSLQRRRPGPDRRRPRPIGRAAGHGDPRPGP